MFDITVADAVLILGIPAMALAAYTGWRTGARAKATEIATAPGVNQTGMALLIDGRVLDRLTIACERLATAIDETIEANERRDDRERMQDQQKMLGLILEELKKKA